MVEPPAAWLKARLILPPVASQEEGVVAVTVGVPGAGMASKLAVTALAADMTTVQVPVPVQAPDQPVKVE